MALKMNKCSLIWCSGLQINQIHQKYILQEQIDTNMHAGYLWINTRTQD